MCGLVVSALHAVADSARAQLLRSIPRHDFIVQDDDVMAELAHGGCGDSRRERNQRNDEEQNMPFTTAVVIVIQSLNGGTEGVKVDPRALVNRSETALPRNANGGDAGTAWTAQLRPPYQHRPPSDEGRLESY